MSEHEKKDAEQWAEDWAGEAEGAALRARQYAELAKRHVATAASLHRRTRRVSRFTVVMLLALLAVQAMHLGFALAEYWGSR